MTPLKNTVSFKFNDRTYTWGDCKNWVLFAGPDIVEDEGLVLEAAQELKRITDANGVPWIFKCSFDKANRTSGKSFRGHGLKEGLAMLQKVKDKVGCPVITDVHETIQVKAVAEVADVIQIPAFLSRQTDLLYAVADTGKVVHIKKGQFLAPWDMKSPVEKMESRNNKNLLLCERGTTFGYNRLVNDMTGLVDMRALGYPVIMDASHSTQLPGASGTSSDGRAHMIPVLARAAMAVGVDGLFIETHPRPDQALCDGPSSLPLAEMDSLLKTLNKIWSIHKQ
ncbi:MAG: 3-deoxy-8-phosphooctulonate synthase [Bdellovibrionaceae bacterium]|nr:3-deoxy-8-phosphooctulonate synthase [Pseudobdellovibrionaceae bacterium]